MDSDKMNDKEMVVGHRRGRKRLADKQFKVLDRKETDRLRESNIEVYK